MPLNLETLKATAATTTTTKKLTLADMIGKQSVLPLPVGLHECKIIETPKLDPENPSTSFRLIVESEGQRYSVVISIGSTPAQGDIFMSIISHLLDQLEMKALDFDVLATKVGETICVLATENVTARGSFTNYSFNQKVMENILRQQMLIEAAAPTK